MSISLLQIFMSRKKKSSRLYINNIRSTDSGNYTCVPSNARPVSVMVHILQGRSIPFFVNYHRENKSYIEKELCHTLVEKIAYNIGNSLEKIMVNGIFYNTCRVKLIFILKIMIFKK